MTEPTRSGIDGAQRKEQRFAAEQTSRGSLFTEAERTPEKMGAATKFPKINGERPISPRRDVGTVADLLMRTQGLECALKRAVNERASARRARNRQRFQFWQAIYAAIEARGNEVKP